MSQVIIELFICWRTSKGFSLELNSKKSCYFEISNFISSEHEFCIIPIHFQNKVNKLVSITFIS